MTALTPEPRPEENLVEGLREFQELFRQPVSDLEIESPVEALSSLQAAATAAPDSYSDYLSEALACYEGGQFRAAVLMVWSAAVAHMLDAISAHRGGISAYEAANVSRYGGSRAYREIRKRGDLMYLKESQLIQLGEDAGMYDRNARSVLEQSLDLRNKCGHPTGFVPGRGEVVIFIERLLLNVIGGAMLSW